MSSWLAYATFTECLGKISEMAGTSFFCVGSLVATVTSFSETRTTSA
jgi:hypothetical protein